MVCKETPLSRTCQPRSNQRQIAESLVHKKTAFRACDPLTGDCCLATGLAEGIETASRSASDNRFPISRAFGPFPIWVMRIRRWRMVRSQLGPPSKSQSLCDLGLFLTHCPVSPQKSRLSALEGHRREFSACRIQVEISPILRLGMACVLPTSEISGDSQLQCRSWERWAPCAIGAYLVKAGVKPTYRQ